MAKRRVPLKPLTKKQLNQIMDREIKMEQKKIKPDMKKIRAIRKLKF